MCEPIKPAPPVMRMLFILFLEFVSLRALRLCGIPFLSVRKKFFPAKGAKVAKEYELEHPTLTQPLDRCRAYLVFAQPPPQSTPALSRPLELQNHARQRTSGT